MEVCFSGTWVLRENLKNNNKKKLFVVVGWGAGLSCSGARRACASVCSVVNQYSRLVVKWRTPLVWTISAENQLFHLRKWLPASLSGVEVALRFFQGSPRSGHFIFEFHVIYFHPELVCETVAPSAPCALFSVIGWELAGPDCNASWCWKAVGPRSCSKSCCRFFFLFLVPEVKLLLWAATPKRQGREWKLETEGLAPHTGAKD